MSIQLLAPIALALCATPVKAQYGYGYGRDNGTSYGTRIGVGVGIAVAVALIILVVGFLMRRRRARAFKTAFPLQQVQHQQPSHNAAEQGHANGYHGQQWNPQSQGNAQQPQYGQQYVPSPGVGAAPTSGGFDAPPPQYANYRQDTGSHYAPPPVPPPMSSHASHASQQAYAPPTSPPPAASASTYAPPPGSPPTHDESGKALTGEEREAWQAAQEARERELAGGKSS
ncbi:hypothetical protein JCM10450v2_004126 [Rhodotorula kratochvilovae]